MPDPVEGLIDLTQKKMLLLLYHNLLLHRKYVYVNAGMWLSLLGQSQTAEELRYDLP